MKFFHVQSSQAKLGLAAPWPAQCPELRLIAPPPLLRVPLATHAPAAPGAPKPPGTHVERGEAMAQMPAGIAPAAIAPVAGRVGNIVKITLLNGQSVPALELTPDAPGGSFDAGVEAAAGDATEGEAPAISSRMGREQLAGWIERLRGLGFWADRPDTPNLLAQLHHVLRHPADTLVCSLLDDEPTICLNSILVGTAAADLLAGLEFLGGLIEARTAIIVVEAGVSGKWWGTFRKQARKADFAVVPLLNDYPQSDPTLLIYTLLKRRLKPGSLPVEQRVLLLDGAAAVAVERCAAGARAMLSVPLALRDYVRQQSHFVDVLVGTPLQHVLDQVQATRGEVTLLRGDLLHDNRISPEAIVAGGELTVHVVPRLHARMPDPCIRCSWCVESCPMRIQPAGLLDAAQRADSELAERYGLEACIECGVCSYVCPSHLPLLGGIRQLKEELKERG